MLATHTIAPSRQVRYSSLIEALGAIILDFASETTDMTVAELKEKLKERDVGLARFEASSIRLITLKEAAYAAEQYGGKSGEVEL